VERGSRRGARAVGRQTYGAARRGNILVATRAAYGWRGGGNSGTCDLCRVTPAAAYNIWQAEYIENSAAKHRAHFF